MVLIFIGCGYKPSNIYTKERIGNNISVYVEMFDNEPESSVNIKDLINQAFITRLGIKIVSEDIADTKIRVYPQSIIFEPIEKDYKGYTISYRTSITLKSEVHTKDKKNTIMAIGNYDFDIKPNSSISEQNRYEAIKRGSIKAVDELLFKLSLER
jgi:hypothetical protein